MIGSCRLCAGTFWSQMDPPSELTEDVAGVVAAGRGVGGDAGPPGQEAPVRRNVNHVR